MVAYLKGQNLNRVKGALSLGLGFSRLSTWPNEPKERNLNLQRGFLGEEKRAREKGEKRHEPPSDFRALERELAELHRLLEERTFESEEEIEEFLNRALAETGGKIPRTAPRTPLEKAQNLVYEAWESEGPGRCPWPAKP
jgi:hypothetical protein